MDELFSLAYGLSIIATIGVIVALSALAVVVAHTFDQDVGGYRDGWLTRAYMPDKLVHAAFGALLCFALSRAMPPVVAAVGTGVIGAAYEVGQGFFSWRDLVADVAGALVVVLYLTLT